MGNTLEVPHRHYAICGLIWIVELLHLLELCETVVANCGPRPCLNCVYLVPKKV
jgi:hypothetical protein